MGNTTVREKEHHSSSNRHRYDSGPMMVSKHSEDSASDGSSCVKGFVGEPSRTRSRANTSSLSLDSEKTLPTVFKWKGGGKQVFISGSFDGWRAKLPLVKSHGDFYTIIDLPEGDHQYKFYVDGTWQCDSKEITIDNEYGTKNNLVRVKATDFEVFDALDVDSKDLESDLRGRGGSPASEYGQVYASKLSVASIAPPVLPPQLLQVILNKETSQQCEPTLLPEPNHVMLNHLYALSIKDGVMVLSTTHRYRKKYITSLLYKPI